MDGYDEDFLLFASSAMRYAELYGHRVHRSMISSAVATAITWAGEGGSFWTNSLKASAGGSGSWIMISVVCFLRLRRGMSVVEETGMLWCLENGGAMLQFSLVGSS